MKNLIFLITILVLSQTSVLAQKYMTRTATIDFYSKAPLEDIEAINNQVSSVIDLESGEMAFSLLMTAFTFEKALMQEHFNEKYVHSDKFPKASFKGKIENFDNFEFSETSNEVLVKGTLTIHGVSKEIETKATLVKKGENIIGTCKFTITLEDYDIKIPSAVKDNISKTIDITVDATYEKM